MQAQTAIQNRFINTITLYFDHRCVSKVSILDTEWKIFPLSPAFICPTFTP